MATSRVPRGVPTGGQFAGQPHPESVVTLACLPADLPEWEPPTGTEDPAGAFSRCKEVSAEYTEHLRVNGINADWIQVVGPRGHFRDAQPEWHTVAQERWQHYLTRVTAADGTRHYIDWTARQFDPAAGHPTILVADEEGWDETYEITGALDRYLAAWRRESTPRT